MASSQLTITIPAKDLINQLKGPLLKEALEALAKELEWAADIRGEPWTTYRDRQNGVKRLGKKMPEVYRQQLIARAAEYRKAASIVLAPCISEEQAKPEPSPAADAYCGGCGSGQATRYHLSAWWCDRCVTERFANEPKEYRKIPEVE